MVQKQKVISDNFTILQVSQKTEYLSCINENCCYFGLCLCEILVLCMANSSIYYYSNSLVINLNKMSKNCTYNFFVFHLRPFTYKFRMASCGRWEAKGYRYTYNVLPPCVHIFATWTHDGKCYKCILITFSPLGLRGNDCPCRNSEGDKRSSVTENYNNWQINPSKQCLRTLLSLHCFEWPTSRFIVAL